MTPADDESVSEARAALPIAQAIGTRRLILAIVLMPVIAVIATIAIIVYAKGRPKPLPAPERAETLILPPGGRIVETIADGRHIILRIDAPGGGEIAVFDIASGERIRTIRIEAP
jgi:hypothetical protein